MSQKLTQEEFIRRCIITHGSKYNYTNSIFTGISNNIIIGCSIHGEFFQRSGGTI